LEDARRLAWHHRACAGGLPLAGSLGRMGSTDSKCAELLEQMAWEEPPFAEEFRNPSLVSYLEVQNLEVVLPKHAPQADLSIPDRMPALFPRPNFCWEAYKMHLALIGPSTACKNQFLAFLPQLAAVFAGAPAKLAPGRNACPYYFFDPDLHKMILWELPEMSWNQTNPDDYIRELGLLYMDCVFMLFSEKYLLNDLYCKLIVAMAIHGIPFFVICTDSSEAKDQATMDKIKTYFQRKDISGIRMFNPKKPDEVVKEIITEFFKEVSWNRSAIDKERTSDVSDTILGQTVRLKELEKKPELNGRCGVCVGFDKDQGRYHIRLITNGVESDIALKQNNFSILKPKMLDAMVRIKDLSSKPELNGRYGFVDAFLRETERYRVLIPEHPGSGQALALKSANLERVEDTHGRPVRPPAPEPKRRAASAKAARPTYGPFVAESTGGQTWKVIGGESKGGIIVKQGKDFHSELESQRLSTSALVEELAVEGDRLRYRLLYGTGPKTGWVSLRVQDRDLLVKSDTVVCGSRVAKAAPPRPAEPQRFDAPAREKVDPTFDPPAREKPASGGTNGGLNGRHDSRVHSGPEASGATAAPKPPEDQRSDGKADDHLSDFLPKQAPAKDGGDDLMSRIRAAEDEEGGRRPDTRARRTAASASESSQNGGMDMGEILRTEAGAAMASGNEPRNKAQANGASASRPAAAPPEEPEDEPIQPCRLTKEGLLAMKVWAVVGDPDDAEDITDQLMDCGKTVFSVSPSGGHVSQVAELDRDPSLPRAEVLALVDGGGDAEEAVAAAPQLHFRGVVLHPGLDAYPPDLAGRFQAAGLEVFGADILEELQPGSGLVVAPLD